MSAYIDKVDSMTWSYSRLRCFEDCSYKWFQRYLLHEEEAPMFYKSYGSFMHELIERYYIQSEPNEELVSDFLSLFSVKVTGERPKDNIVQKYIRSGVDYLSSMKPLPYKMRAVEDKIDFTVDGNRFVGFIDYLGERDGELVVVDHKSRSLKPRSKRKKPTQNDEELDEMLTQLYIYSSGVEQKYGKLPKWLCFNCFKDGTLIEEEFDPVKYEKALRWATDTIHDIRSESHFSPNFQWFFCTFLCGYHYDCCYYDMLKT